MTFEELEEWEGLNFDVIVTLSPEAHHQALELTRTLPVEVEYWPTPDPSVIAGSREQQLDAYREVRDQLMKRIKARFAWRPGGNE
jgi:protein-tyrosine-phosphatase